MKPTKNVLLRRLQRNSDLDITKPVALPVDFSRVSPHEREVARYQSEDARTGQQTDETPPTVRFRKQRLQRAGKK